MAPISTSSGLQHIVFAIIIISCIIVIATLPFLATAIWIICTDIWRVMVTNRPNYLKREKLRKEWNKEARIEQDRQRAAKCIIRDMVEKERKPEERWFLLLKLVSKQDLVY
jgi:hypothetical protein